MTFVSRPSLSAIYIRGLFLNPYLLCVLYVCRFYYAVSLPNNKKKTKTKTKQRKKQFIGFSFKFLQFNYPKVYSVREKLCFS